MPAMTVSCRRSLYGRAGFKPSGHAVYPVVPCRADMPWLSVQGLSCSRQSVGGMSVQSTWAVRPFEGLLYAVLVGCHPRLLESCLQDRQSSPVASAEDAVFVSQRIWQALLSSLAKFSSGCASPSHSALSSSSVRFSSHWTLQHRNATHFSLPA